MVPTLVVWGMRDAALCPELTHGLEAYIPDLTLHPVADASHWIAHEQPQLWRGGSAISCARRSAFLLRPRHWACGAAAGV